MSDPTNGENWYLLSRSLLAAVLQGPEDEFQLESSVSFLEALDRSIELGNAKAMKLLALAHLFGWSVPEDRSLGIEWMEKSAKHGDESAEIFAALLLLIEPGLDAEMVERAESFLDAASGRGDERASRFLAVVARYQGDELRSEVMQIIDELGGVK